MSNAHEHARMALKAAVRALEGSGTPTLADFKDARDLSKSAHETLDAAHKLLSKGILQVVDADDEKTPLFTEEGAPTAEAEAGAAPPAEPDPEAAPEADLTLPALSCAPYPEAIDVEIVGSSVVGEGGEIVDGSETAETAEPVEATPEDEAEAFLRLVKESLRDADGKKASTKFLRAKFQIGYEKAKAIMERLLADGFINDSGEVIA